MLPADSVNAMPSIALTGPPTTGKLPPTKGEAALATFLPSLPRTPAARSTGALAIGDSFKTAFADMEGEGAAGEFAAVAGALGQSVHGLPMRHVFRLGRRLRVSRRFQSLRRPS